MNEAIDFETYLIISQEKFEIFLFDIKNFTNLYKEKIKFENQSENIDFNLLNIFLETNIYKIEKLAGSFVKNINVVIENKSIVNFDLSIKKKKYTGNITNIFVENILSDANDLFQESYSEHKLIHMLINKYIINGISYSSLQDKINSDEISIEIKLISISNLLISQIENVLKKYQIQVDNYLDKKYIKDFLDDEKSDISQMAHKLLNGFNTNEVYITLKTTKKQGFFEKFFQLFS